VIVAAAWFDSCRREPSMPKRPKDPHGKSLVRKRTFILDGHKSGAAVEDAFWDAFKEIAAAQGIPVSQLISAIDSERQHPNLSSAIRLFVLEYYRSRVRP
jgi:predicted DNA-binding ribbon-helix-helix protein